MMIPVTVQANDQMTAQSVLFPQQRENSMDQPVAPDISELEKSGRRQTPEGRGQKPEGAGGRHNSWEVHAALRKGMAPQNSPDGQRHSPERAMPMDRNRSIVGATGHEPAGAER